MKTVFEILNLINKGEKFNFELKKTSNGLPNSIFETYSSFANTAGGIIVLGVEEDKSKKELKERYTITGLKDANQMKEDFWNTINSKRVSNNILLNDDVYILNINNLDILVIEVPRADFTMRPIYIGDNPFKGTYKRNHEGDYHAKEFEVRAMLRDQSDNGYDGKILEGYNLSDIDSDTLKKYRIMFDTRNPNHVWNTLDDKAFLEMLGGYRKDRRENVEGLTVAGLMMFGKGLAIRDEFDNLFMDYLDESDINDETRWVDRVTIDGTWENNLFNFFRNVMPKLTNNLSKPFVLENLQRVDDTRMHKAIREAFVNMIIHADYRMESGCLKIIKGKDFILFSNPGNLKLSKEQIFKGGESKSRNPRIQTMFRMIGYGDNAGSGFPNILKTWKIYGLPSPELEEDTILNKVTLTLKLDLKEGKMSEDFLEFRENERRLSEVLSEVLEPVDYNKLKDIIKYLEDFKSITPNKVKELTGKSEATVRRYLNILVNTGLIKKEGKTSNTRYVYK